MFTVVTKLCSRLVVVPLCCFCCPIAAYSLRKFAGSILPVERCQVRFFRCIELRKPEIFRSAEIGCGVLTLTIKIHFSLFSVCNLLMCGLMFETVRYDPFIESQFASRG